jgi:inorganic pyrophosphatase
MLRTTTAVILLSLLLQPVLGAHPWRDLATVVPARGRDAAAAAGNETTPMKIHAVVEISRGGKVKYEVDKETVRIVCLIFEADGREGELARRRPAPRLTAPSLLDKKKHQNQGLLFVDRILGSSVVYPTHYGFIPRTENIDRDPLDVLVLAQDAPVAPGAFMRARVVGLLKMTDGAGDAAEQDDKVVAVCDDDPAYAHVGDARTDLPAHVVAEIKRFFETYKRDDGGVSVEGAFGGPREARAAVEAAMRRYEEGEGAAGVGGVAVAGNDTMA